MSVRWYEVRDGGRGVVKGGNIPRKDLFSKILPHRRKRLERRLRGRRGGIEEL